MKKTYEEFLKEQKEIMETYNMGFFTANEFYHQLLGLTIQQIDVVEDNGNSLSLEEHKEVRMVLTFVEPTAERQEIMRKLDFHISRIEGGKA